MSTLYTFISRYGRKKPLLAGTYQQFEKSQYNARDFVKLNICQLCVDIKSIRTFPIRIKYQMWNKFCLNRYLSYLHQVFNVKNWSLQ